MVDLARDIVVDAATATLLPTLMLASVVARKGQRGALAAKMVDLYALELGEGPHLAQGAGLCALGTAPGAWLFIASVGDPHWASRLAADLKGLASVSDQSDAYVGVEVVGPEAVERLGRGLVVDVHASVFPTGAAALTSVGYLGLVVWRLGTDRFNVLCFRSFATDFHHWLEGMGITLAVTVAG